MFNTMLDWSHLLEQYGYLAVAIGTFFEGETVLLLGAYAVQQHLLNFWLLIAAAMLGGFLGDQFYYQIGAKYGYDFVKKRPKLAEKFDNASQLIDRFPIITILFMRFAWGLRTLIPISFGIKKFPVKRYIAVNIIASFVWAFTVVSVGIQASRWLHKLWDYLLPQQHNILIVVAVIFCIIVIRLFFVLMTRHKSKEMDDSDG